MSRRIGSRRGVASRSGLTTDQWQRIRDLEREVRELKRANEILRKTSA
jgi:transposase